MSAGGRPPQHPDRSGRSLAQTSIAKQIAEASKSPRPARSGDRHSRCPQRAEVLVLAPSAESANLCESLLAPAATAASPLGSCQQGRWSPEGRASSCGRSTAHRRHARARFVLAGRALLVPEASVRSGHQRTTASVTAPLSCITSPRWATQGYFPSPRCPPGWVAPGPPPPGSTTDNTSTPTLRSEQTVVDRSGRCD
jgi:hypothetical protein